MSTTPSSKEGWPTLAGDQSQYRNHASEAGCRVEVTLHVAQDYRVSFRGVCRWVGKRMDDRPSARRKSSLVSPRIRFGIAMCSLQDPPQVGLLKAAPEKRADGYPLFPWQSVLRSPTCRAEIAKIGRISQFSRETRTGILCTSDCMAEREGFEPPVRFFQARVA